MLLDTHAHLSKVENPRLDELGGILDIGLEPGDLEQRIAAFSRFPPVRFAAGLWPHREVIPRRRELAARLGEEIDRSPPGLVVAVGECGLDRRENPADGNLTAAEAELLELQLELAEARNLPVIIHSREAAADTLRILSGHPRSRGVIHCFSYGPEELARFLDLGFYVSFAGNLTFKNAPLLRESVALVPEDRLLLETDAPFLAPVPYRGRPASPEMVAATYQVAAQVRGVSEEALEARIWENARSLFQRFPAAL